jgi:hypothetical protein
MVYGLQFRDSGCARGACLVRALCREGGYGSNDNLAIVDDTGTDTLCFSAQHPIADSAVWCLEFGVWCLVFVAWCLVFGVWCLSFGLEGFEFRVAHAG